MALLPHRRRGEERGRQKRLDFLGGAKKKGRCRAGNQLCPGEVSSRLVSSSSNFGSKSNEKYLPMWLTEGEYELFSCPARNSQKMVPPVSWPKNF